MEWKEGSNRENREVDREKEERRKEKEIHEESEPNKDEEPEMFMRYWKTSWTVSDWDAMVKGSNRCACDCD